MINGIPIGARVMVIPVLLYGRLIGWNLKDDSMVDVELELQHTTKPKPVTATCWPGDVVLETEWEDFQKKVKELDKFINRRTV